MRGYSIPSRTKKEIRLFDFSRGMDGRSDERLSAWDTAASTFNLKLADGALKTGCGTDYAEFIASDGSKYSPRLPSGVTPVRAYHYEYFDGTAAKRRDKLLVYCSDGYFYTYEIGTKTPFSKIIFMCFDKPPIGVLYRLNGEDVMLFANDDGITVYDGVGATLYEAPKMTSLCVHGERLFVTSGAEDTRLWFSQSFDPTNWYVSLTEAGFIDFLDGKGRLLKAIAFKDYVYVFRNYGITRLTAYGEQEDFYATGVQSDRARIYGDTVADCGKVVFYLTESGFYYFDGSNSGRIMKGLDKYLEGVDNSDSFAQYVGGAYFCSLKIKIDGQTVPVILRYDDTDGSWYLIKGIECKSLFAFYGAKETKLFVCSSKTNGLLEITDEGYDLFAPLKFEWTGKPFDCGLSGRKTLERISFYSDKSGKLKIKSDEGEETLEFSSKGFKGLPVGLKGTEFSISYESTAVGAYLSRVRVTVSKAEG